MFLARVDPRTFRITSAEMIFDTKLLSVFDVLSSVILINSILSLAAATVSTLSWFIEWIMVWDGFMVVIVINWSEWKYKVAKGVTLQWIDWKQHVELWRTIVVVIVNHVFLTSVYPSPGFSGDYCMSLMFLVSLCCYWQGVMGWLSRVDTYHSLNCIS